MGRITQEKTGQGEFREGIFLTLLPVLELAEILEALTFFQAWWS